MLILHVASYSPNGTPPYRAVAMRRLGHDVVDFDLDPLLGSPCRLAAALRIRLLIGPAVSAVNRRLLEVARGSNFDLIWLDKPIWVRPATVRALRATGAATVSYMPDNPFGPRGDPGWRLYRAAVAAYSAHVIANPASMQRYRDAGAARVLVMPVPYEPTVYHAPPDDWTDANRDVAVSFVGSPHDERADFFRALARDHGIMVRIWGEPTAWASVFSAEEMAKFHAGAAVYHDGFRQVIWRSRINLGFVARANLDTYAQRWFEISGAGGFLLAERTEDGLRAFDSGAEAAFFGDLDECAAQIRRYLPDEAARTAIARAGHARAVASGYDNDARLRVVFDALADLLPRR